ncbi:MAG: portal protein, partial [Patescibacteria group bacterium]
KAFNAAVPIIRSYELYSNIQATDWRYEAAKDVAFVNSSSWEENSILALKNDNQPVTTNNEMKPVRDQVINQITDSDPEWLAIPQENSDASISEEMSALMHYIWGASNSRMHYTKSCGDLLDTGLFVMHTYYDPNGDMGKGELKIVRVNPQDITLDPRCSWRNAQDSQRIFLTGLYSKSIIENMYPDFDFDKSVAFEMDNRMYSNRAITDGQVFQAFMLADEFYYRVIDCYTKIKMDMVWIYDPNSNYESTLSKGEYKQFQAKPAIILVRTGQEKVITQTIDIQQYMKIASTYGTTFHQNTDGSIDAGAESQEQKINAQGQVIQSIPGSTTQIHIVTMGDLINEGKIKWQIVKVDRIKRDLVVGEKLYRSLIMPISHYPFGITMLHHTDTPYCYGDARLVRSIQEQINKINSLIIAYNINITNVKVFIPKYSQARAELEKRWGKAGAQFFEFDPELGGVPVVVQLTQMSNYFYTQLDRLRAQIQRIYGAYEFQDGLVDKAPDTASGTNHLDEMGFRRSKGKLDLIEGALDDLGSVIAEMIPFVYDQRKLIRVLLPNNKTKNIEFNKQVNDGDITRILNDLSTNRYDFKIKSGSTLPTNMAARRNMLLRMFELKAIKDPTPLLRETGLPNIEEIIQNESLINQMMQQAQQMQQTIKTLGGQLQTKSREKVHADEKVQIEKFKSDLAEMKANMKHGILLGKERINDAVKESKNKMDELSNNNNNGQTQNEQVPQGVQ